jgi:succinate-semialdehyde dehydrogenase/glutarate-semialdehyde dehydrogenase
MNDEPFGPVAPLSSFASIHEGLIEANRLPYGLAAYVFTRPGDTADAVAGKLQAGMVTVNHLGFSLPELPFGGVKDSGYGSEGGIEAMEAYQITKLVTTFDSSPEAPCIQDP